MRGGGFPSTCYVRATGGGCVPPRSPTWDALRRGAFVVPPRRGLLFGMRGHRRIKRVQDVRAHLGREPPVQHHGAVIFVPEGEAAVLMLRIGPFGLFSPLGSAIQAHELLHVLGGAVQSDVEKVVLVLGGGDAGQSPDLGVAEFALRERLRQQRQPGQRPGDADLLARGVGVDAAGPREPRGAGQRPLRSPDLAPVELGDEDEEAVRGGVDVGGEGGDGGGESVVVHGGEFIHRDGGQGSHGFSMNDSFLRDAKLYINRLCRSIVSHRVSITKTMISMSSQASSS